MQQHIKKLIKKGILLSPDIVDKKVEISCLLNSKGGLPLVCDASVIDTIKQNLPNIEEDNNKKTEVKYNIVTTSEKPRVDVLEVFEEKNTKKTVKDFVNLYNNRYKILQSVLHQRQELQTASSIKKIRTTLSGQQVSFISIILDIKKTKKGHIILTLEDQTGVIKGIVTITKKDLYKTALELTPDEVIGIVGNKGDNVVFINSILFPGVPIASELRKSSVDEAVVFTGDLHIGSKVFLEKDFLRLISWLKQETGSRKQKEIAKKVKYLFILGDVVEGIGVYPSQEKDLKIKDVIDQYSLFSDIIKKIPSHIQIIICPGNHDSIRIAEPQPPLPKSVINELYQYENVTLVSSPCTVAIGSGNTTLNVLIYHGFSFPYYANTIESIRVAGGLSNIENIMSFLLKKRHLAPTHGSTQYQLGYEGDPLAIKKVPDFFVSGHVHRATIKNYQNITMLNCSCWIPQTPYQEKRGIVPQPSRAIYINLMTREGKILNFSKNE